MKKEARPFPHVLISHAAEDAPSLPVKASPLEATSGGTSARKVARETQAALGALDLPDLRLKLIGCGFRGLILCIRAS